jgi:hypothetical protein
VGIEDLQDSKSGDMACLYLDLLSSKHMYVGSHETDKMATYVIKSYFLSAHKLEVTFVGKNNGTRIKTIKTDSAYINCDVYANICSWFNMCGFYVKKKQNILKIFSLSLKLSNRDIKYNVHVYYQRPSGTQAKYESWGNLTFWNFRNSRQKMNVQLASGRTVRVISQYGLGHMSADSIFYNAQLLSGESDLVSVSSYDKDFYKPRKFDIQDKKIADFMEHFYEQNVLEHLGKGTYNIYENIFVAVDFDLLTHVKICDMHIIDCYLYTIWALQPNFTDHAKRFIIETWFNILDSIYGYPVPRDMTNSLRSFIDTYRILATYLVFSIVIRE